MLSKRDQRSSCYGHHLLDNTFLDTRIIAREVYRTSIVAQSVDRGLEAEVMLFGVWMTILRFGLMYAFPNLYVAIGGQVLHGAMVCAIMVMPPTFLNGLATESNRNSIQGVYTMLVIGTSRFFGTAIGGHVAGIDQRLIYLMCTALALVGLVLLWIGFRPGRCSKSC